MKFEFIKHSNCNPNNITEICKIKNQYWVYSIEEQKKWLNNNISKDDFHVLLYEDTNKLVGYLSLVLINVKFEDHVEEMYGVGSVCVDENNRGEKLGYLLMKLVDFFLYKKNKKGILLCKNSLVEFYEKCNWIQYTNKVICNNSVFLDNVFINQNINSKHISISKLF